MANPFFRRATEYVRDPASFLAIVSPAPLTALLARHPHKDELFDVPVRVIGAPGSGKTMLATLVEFRLVETIVRDPSSETHRELAAALADAGFLREGLPRVAAVRVPMESEYRDFWELPYEASVRTKLALWLIQSRAMLGLFRNLTASGNRDAEDIRFLSRDSTEIQFEQIGGSSVGGIRDRALSVQRAVYSIVAGLRPPSLEDLPEIATAPYEPFDALQRIEIDWEGKPLRLAPLVILDDVHALHPDQFQLMFKTLARREIKFGRWMMMRMDALSPTTVLRSPHQIASHNLKSGRDFIDVLVQRRGDRGQERRQFRHIAQDMANRYLSEVQSLKSRNATRIEPLLPSKPPELTGAQMEKLTQSIKNTQRKLGISDSRRSKIVERIEKYLASTSSHDTSNEIALAMCRILFHRYINRVDRTLELFDDFDPEPKKPLKADAQVAEAARLQLHAEFNRPFYFGLADLCDASNENAEVFLQLAGALVAVMETRVIRNRPPALPADLQEKVLKKKAQEILDSWSFPYVRQVSMMIDRIGRECLEMSLTPNARLGSGCNAVGVLEDEISLLLESEDQVALILKYAMAYGAINVQRNYGQGGKLWCLLELSGIACLAHGLTFKRGGFLEKRVSYLKEIIR